MFQAADVALKKDMQAAIKSGQVSTICVISDDKGFTEMIEWAKSNGITTIVIGNTPSLRVCGFSPLLLSRLVKRGWQLQGLHSVIHMNRK